MASIYDEDDTKAGGKGPVSPDDLRSQEEAADNSGGQAAPDQVGKGFTGEVKDHSKRFLSTVTGMMKGASWRKKAMVATAAGSVVVGLALALVSIFNFLNIFQLDNLLSNIERKGFIRYQVDMEGRSNAWINAYLMLRLGEVEDPSLKPADRDNILFRANKVQTGNPVLDWYKTMRTSKFEAELLERQGIKFASIACRGTIVNNECKPGGNVVRFRPAIVTIGDEQIKFELKKPEITAIENGDVNGFNNRLRQFVDVQVLANDKAGRNAIKEAVNANTKYYQVIKRYYLRKSIQNMTGIRDWRFFEKTRDKVSEKKIEIRNKIIAKSFPESTKSGKFIQCIFGITECKTNTDPSNPANKSALAPVAENCRDTPDNPKCKTGKVDSEGKPVTNDGSAEAGLADGVSSGADDLTESLSKKMLTKVLDKINVGTGIVSFIDTLNTVNKNLRNGALSSMVYNARAAQAIGLFTTAGIMRDQMRTGEVTAEEVNQVMDVMVENAGSSEGWQTLVANQDAGIASAAAMEPAATKEAYCSPEHQEQMLLPENEKVAKSEYHWLCDSEKIGGDNLAKDIEDGWNNSVGVILNPILDVYDKSGLGTVVGWFNSAVEAVVGPIMKATVDGILGALGLKDDFQNLMGWLMNKAASVLGAGPAMSESAPPGVYANHMFMGAAAASEAGMRGLGAAATTNESAALATDNVVAFEQHEKATASFSQKYLSLANADSLAARSLFAVTNQHLSQTISSAFAGILNAPLRLFGGNATAAAPAFTGYEAAKFAGVETYDFPAQCNQHPFDMTPQSSTNADDVGLIPASDLTWDLVTNSDEFYARLYQDSPNDNVVKSVYNCALRDTAVRGGLGAMYDSKTLGPNAYGAGFSTGNIDIADLSAAELKSSSLNTPCADGTTEVTKLTGYTGGNPVGIKLCAIPGLPSSSEESRPGSKYYIPGANGLALVNAKVSSNFLALVNAAKRAGLAISATSSFRTMAHQEDICNDDSRCKNGNYTYVAKPGTSNHQMGLAIDFKFTTIGNDSDNCVIKDGVCTAPNDPLWSWLETNAQQFDIGQYRAEFWHWEPEALRE